jgi:hypothetical protein
MFTKEDFKIDSAESFFEFLIIAPFIGFISPFLFVSYTVGKIADMVGHLDY